MRAHCPNTDDRIQHTFCQLRFRFHSKQTHCIPIFRIFNMKVFAHIIQFKRIASVWIEGKMGQIQQPCICNENWCFCVRKTAKHFRDQLEIPDQLLDENVIGTTTDPEEKLYKNWQWARYLHCAIFSPMFMLK